MDPNGLPTLEEYTSGERKTLGWEILNWGSTYLGQPDRDDKGQVWQYTNEQALFLLRLYEVDAAGRFVYRRAVLERPKGWGKSPLLAAICCTELIGPVVFDGWDVNGEPVGRPHPSPLVQIAAISESQVNNTMTLVAEMLLEGEANNAYPELDVRLSKVSCGRGRLLERVTASPRSREGNRATFVVMDETHLWIPAEKGPQLADALRRNAAKMDARTVETTNAHLPGEGSVAEASHNAWLKMQTGQTFDKALLFDTQEAFVEDIYDWEQAYPALVKVYGSSAVENGGWIHLKDRIWAEINDPDYKEHTSRRYFFNEKTEGKSTWLSEQEWKGCYDPEIVLNPELDQFALGFKGSMRNGSTALVGCRLSDSALFLLGLWEKPEDAPMDWEVPWSEVSERLTNLLSKAGCNYLVADPENWQEILGRISAAFPDQVEELWLSKNRAKAVKAIEQFETAAKSRRLKWADQSLSKHVLSCHTVVVGQSREDREDILIRKETRKSKRYIDAAQAAVLALEASVQSIEDGALTKQSLGGIWSF
jgi:hypothetical protein